MKRHLLTILCGFITLLTLNACATLNGYDDIYYSQQYDEGVVVRNNICYVYYSNPSTAFLNSLYLNNGSFYYLNYGRYIPVIFPRWNVWSSHRYFYRYDNGWRWRDRERGYNHNEWRRTQPWFNHKQPNIRNTPQRFNNGKFTTRNGQRMQPNRSFGNGVRQSPNKPNNNGRFGGRR